MSDTIETNAQFSNELESERTQFYQEQYDAEVSRHVGFVNNLLFDTEKLHRYLITTASVVLGILVSLGLDNDKPHQIRWCLAVAVALLALSILMLSISLNRSLRCREKAMRLHAEETRKAFEERRQQGYIAIPKTFFGVLIEKVGLISFLLALFFLAVYAVLWAVI